MEASPLVRHAGPIVLIAGAYLVVAHVTLRLVLTVDELPVLTAHPGYRVASVAYAAAFAGLLMALFAAYARQAREAGRFGLVALFAATLGTFTLGADMWFEGFAAPWLIEVVPRMLDLEKTTLWVIGYFSSYLLFAMGWALFGLASLRARVFPLPISVAITIGGLIGFLAATPPYGAALGLALVGLGGWLIKAERRIGATKRLGTVLAQ
jgi:hypothetical protein